MAYIQVQLRRGTTQEWYDANTQLAQGEIGLNTTTNQFKIGDGETLWRDLPYGGLQGPSVLWNYRGAYDASIAYDEGDLVTYNLSLYYRLGASIGFIGSTPGTDPTKWQLTVGGSSGNGGTSGGALDGNLAGTSGGWHFSGANEYPQYMTALANAIIGVGTDFNGNVSSSNLSVIASDAIWHFNHDGNLVLPDGGYILNGDLTVYGGTGGGGTIWTNDANGCLRAELSATGFEAFTDQSHVDLKDSGIWSIGSYGNSTWIGNNEFANLNDLSLRSGDATFITTNLRESGNHQWKFGTDGVLNLPNNNGQIGQLEPPYTGLEFRTGSGADWIGISYGEIDDNNTSYFYFDKDGEDYLTANHQAHLQIKNPAHDGHVEWLFDSNGSLTFPQGTVLGTADGPGAFIIDGAADKDILIYTYGSSTAHGWTFDIDGDLKVPQEIRNPQGHRAIWSNEVPRDISDLTDNNLLLAINSIAPDMNWDGGAAAATYSINTNADGGFSSTRWGINSIKFDGGAGAGSSHTETLNGGVA